MTQRIMQQKKRIFSLILAIVMVVGIISPGSAIAVKAGDTAYQTKLTAVTKCLHDNVEPVYTGEWALLQQARGENADKKWIHSYYDSLIEQLKDDEKTSKMKSSDWARVILAVEALGEDPTNFEGKNLFVNLSDFEKIGIYSIWDVSKASYILMGVADRKDDVFANDKVKAENRTNKNKLKEAILSFYNPDNKCWYSDYGMEIDTSAQAIQALSGYYKTDEKVKKIIDDTLETLAQTIGDDGCVQSWGSSNPCSTAQLICALISLGIDPARDTRFQKNGKNLIDGLCSLFDPKSGGINAADWNTGAEYLDLQFNTVQAGYALTAYDRFVNGKSFVFNISDVKAPTYHYGGKATCVKKAVCESCKKEYGELAPENHTGKTEYKNIKAATFTEKGYTGDKVCADCGIVLEKGTDVEKIVAADSSYTINAADPSNPTIEYKSDDVSKSIVTIQNTVRDTNGNVYKVTKVADNAFADNKNITSVTMGANVTEIGTGAFKNCTKLSDIIIQDGSITKIDADAFAGAAALKTIDLSECKLVSIDTNAFANCKKLATVKIDGNKLTKVGKNAFMNIKKNAKIMIFAKNKKTYNKVVKMIKKSGAKKVKYSFKKKK